MVIEPVDGTELERLITALLNATGVVNQLIEQVLDEEGPGDGVGIIDINTERLRNSLSFLAEHFSDDDLFPVTCCLGIIAFQAAEHLGIDDVFYEHGS